MPRGPPSACSAPIGAAGLIVRFSETYLVVYSSVDDGSASHGSDENDDTDDDPSDRSTREFIRPQLSLYRYVYAISGEFHDVTHCLR